MYIRLDKTVIPSRISGVRNVCSLSNNLTTVAKQCQMLQLNKKNAEYIYIVYTYIYKFMPNIAFYSVLSNTVIWSF